MAMSFNLVVACNSLVALRRFSVFLNNYLIQEKPNFLERTGARLARPWLNRQAMKMFLEVKKEAHDARLELNLNTTPTDLFTVCHLAVVGYSPDTAEELFATMAETELTFERLKTPRTAEAYGQ